MARSAIPLVERKHGKGGMIGMRTIAGILLGVVVLTTTGCHGQNYVPDYCEAEGRRVPDREKKIRMLVEDYERQGRVIQLASHYRRWMGRNAPDPGNGPQVNEAIEQYLNDHPRFAQIVGRELDESSEWMKGRSNELKTYYEAIEKGYYADLVFMTGDDPDYPRSKELGNSSSERGGGSISKDTV